MNGSLDTTFAGDGKALISLELRADLARFPFVSDAVVLGDGKILLAGQDYNGSFLGVDSSNLLVARLTTAGQLDPGFGTGGLAAFEVPGGISGGDVVVRPDGKILVFGSTVKGQSFAVLRLNPDGSPDVTFDADGLLVVAQTGHLTGAALTGSGGMVLGGDSAVVKLREDGSLDPTFGNAGRVDATALPGGLGAVQALAVQADGKVVLAGTSNALLGRQDFRVARLLADGTVDAGFGDRGGASVTLGRDLVVVSSMAIQSDGRILVAGGVDGDFAVARFEASGRVDAGFDGDGWAVVPIRDGTYDYAYAVAQDDEGRIVLAGSTRSYAIGATYDFAAARLTGAGSLDASFGSGGVVTVDFGSDDQGTAMALQPLDGKIVIAGHSPQMGSEGYSIHIAVARLNAVAPPKDPSPVPIDPIRPIPGGSGRRPIVLFYRGIRMPTRVVGTPPPTPAPAPAPVSPSSKPPGVAWATLSRGRRPTVAIGLDSPLLRGAAGRADGYRLFAAGGDGVLGTGDDELVPIASVRYQAARRMIRITPRALPPGALRLVVQAGTLVSPARIAAGTIIRDLA